MSNFSDNALEKDIYRSLLFFDIFNQPLSLLELYKSLHVKTSLDELRDVLLSMSDKVSLRSGFYFLKGRDVLITERLNRYNYFHRKLKIAKKFSRLLSLVPFVRAVFVSNVISSHNLRDESDIDLLIISSSKRIWLTRFLCVILAKILNLRPNSNTKKDKICLSFYLSEDNMNLEKYLYNEDDLYFIHWLYNLELIMDKDNILARFIFDNNWLKSYLPNVDNTYFKPELKTVTARPKAKYFWPLLESCIKKIQLTIMPKKLLDQASQLGGVVLQDDIIKLFLEDKRPLFINELKNKYSAYDYKD